MLNNRNITLFQIIVRQRGTYATWMLGEKWEKNLTAGEAFEMRITTRFENAGDSGQTF